MASPLERGARCQRYKRTSLVCGRVALGPPDRSVEAALARVLSQEIELRLVAGSDRDPVGSSAAGVGATPDETIDLDELRDAPPDGRSSVDRITDAFPGAMVVDNDGSM